MVQKDTEYIRDRNGCIPMSQFNTSEKYDMFYPTVTHQPSIPPVHHRNGELPYHQLKVKFFVLHGNVFIYKMCDHQNWGLIDCHTYDLSDTGFSIVASLLFQLA